MFFYHFNNFKERNYKVIIEIAMACILSYDTKISLSHFCFVFLPFLNLIKAI